MISRCLQSSPRERLPTSVTTTSRGFAFRRTLGAVKWVRQHQAWVTRLGGVMLIMVGLLLVTGLWDQWVGGLRSWVGGFEVLV